MRRILGADRGEIVGRVLFVAAAVVVAAASSFAVRLVWHLSAVFHENPVAVIRDAIRRGGGSSVDTSASSGRRITIALYGYGGDGHDGAYLSDSIMVVSIQPHPGGATQIAEISVPRDWYVPIDLGNGHRYHGRINEAYSDGQTDAYPDRAADYKGDGGGGALANETLERVLGIHIDHYVGVDFHAFQYAVDAVGGIDVNVANSFTDPQYPHGECDAGDCRVMTVHFDAGPQHMDGGRALEFARSRHASDNPAEATDFARSRRQQLVLLALKQKILSVGGISRLPDVLSALGDHVRTDLSLGDAEALYALVKDVDPRHTEHVSVDDTNFLYECGYPTSCSAAYLFTRDPSFRTVSHFAADVFPDPRAVAEQAPVTVEDGSGLGLDGSARWTKLLGMTGLEARDGGAASPSAATRVVDASGGRGRRTAQWLADFFDVPVETVAAPPGGGGVTLVLGHDEESSFSPARDDSAPAAPAAPAGPGPTTPPAAGRTAETSTTSSAAATATPATTSTSTSTSTGGLLPPILGPRPAPTPTPPG